MERYNQQRGGGAPAVPRLYVSDLMSDLRFNEADDVFHLAGGRSLFSPAEQAEFSLRRFDSVGNPEAQIRHLLSLANNAATLTEIAEPQDRIQELSRRLDAAIAAFASLRASGIELDPRYPNRLTVYREALADFRSAVGL